MRRLLFAIILSIAFSSCLKDEPFKQEYAGYEPAIINDDWTISTPEAENMDRSKLDSAYRLLHLDKRFWMARSLLVIRNGRLVAEAYPHDREDGAEFANIQSCTKTFTSIMLGVAIQDGVALSADDRLYDIYPEFFDADLQKRDITLANALSMQTGLEFNNNVHTLRLYQTEENSTRFVLSFPMLDDPGTVSNYNDGAPHLVSKAIERKVGKTMAEYAREKLFDPLGITDWQWESAHDGTTFGAFSLYLKPRDFAKVGQLLIQQGKWANNQLIDPAYLETATAQQVNSNIENKPYGYYFWIDQRNQGFYAHGHGGQILLVVPDKELVALYTAWPYTSGDYFDDGFEMLNLIADACR